jgi:hypothetical protein
VIRAGNRRVVVLGMLSRMPFAGVAWQTLHYLVGFQRLGCEVTYVEAHGTYPAMFGGSEGAATYIDRILRKFDLGKNWVYQARHDDDRCFGLSEGDLQRRLESADLVLNLHGGTMPRPEHYATGRLFLLETDPVALQIELHDRVQAAIDFLEPHAGFFTFAENYGFPNCPLPVSSQFRFRPTRQPVVTDWWASEGPDPRPNAPFTTIGNWKQDQRHRDVLFQGEAYAWSKHREFMRFLQLPQHTTQPFELALASCEPADQSLLEEHGWRVVDALDLSKKLHPYRSYIQSSRGEFTVAKDQNIRLRTGWFSDRSATYLAACRPVITQDTGFGRLFPTGVGLFAFAELEEVVEAVELINADYSRHSSAAGEIAREHFDSDVVLGRLLQDVGL